MKSRDKDFKMLKTWIKNKRFKAKLKTTGTSVKDFLKQLKKKSFSIFKKFMRIQ